jgi:Amidohydrolase family
VPNHPVLVFEGFVGPAAVRESGIRAGMSSDGMQISTISPWINLYYVVTGKNARGELINAGQTLPRKDALRLYTADNGWFLNGEDKLGTIEAGKYADLVVLDRDYCLPAPAMLLAPVALPVLLALALQVVVHDSAVEDRQHRLDVLDPLVGHLAPVEDGTSHRRSFPSCPPREGTPEMGRCCTASMNAALRLPSTPNTSERFRPRSVCPNFLHSLRPRGAAKIAVYTRARRRQNDFRVIVPDGRIGGDNRRVQTLR